MNAQNHTPLSRSIIKTLLYYDIFQYPLTAEEVFQNLQTNSVTPADVASELSRMAKDQLIFKFDQFYSVTGDETLEARRKKGNELARKTMTKAFQRARLISWFPFVRSVMVSGSLSKGYMDEHSDIDFFVVTANNRLWISRAMLGLFRRVFLLNSKKFFCTNYFIDEEHLVIEEQNLFTATELSTLIPLEGIPYYTRMLQVNGWVKAFLPNFRERSVLPGHSENLPWAKKWLEKFFNLVGGARLNRALMRMAFSRWKRKYRPGFNEADFKIAYKTNEHISKGHGGNYQRKITDLYQRKLNAFSLEPDMP